MSKSVYIGELNEKIQIVDFTKVSSGTGAKETTEVVYKSCWAKLEAQSGSEEDEGKVRMLDVRSYVVRYDVNLLGHSAVTKYVKTSLNEKFNIHSVEPIGRKWYLRLKCSRRE